MVHKIIAKRKDMLALELDKENFVQLTEYPEKYDFHTILLETREKPRIETTFTGKKYETFVRLKKVK